MVILLTCHERPSKSALNVLYNHFTYGLKTLIKNTLLSFKLKGWIIKRGLNPLIKYTDQRVFGIP